MSEKNKNEAKTSSINKAGIMTTIAPFIGLAVVLIVFSILTGGKLLSAENLPNISNQVITTALVTIGAVFVFGAGYFDMSLGGSVCFSAVMGGLVAISTGNLVLSIIVIVIVSLAFGFVKGLFASFVNVPFFIFTIVLASVISSVVLVILGSRSTLFLNDAVSEIPSFSFETMSIINLICLAIFFVICLLIFKLTPLGVMIKNVGGNKVSAKQSGIPIKKTTIITFMMSAVGVAIAATLILIRTRAVGGSTGGTLGNDVMVALVLGGMPLSGGPRTKITAGLVGAITITVLNSGLTIMGLSTGAIQICRGIIFIAVVFISSFSYRSKLLPR